MAHRFLEQGRRRPNLAPVECAPRSLIGIILCAEKDNLKVESALKSKTNPIGVAEYQLRGALPARLRGKPRTAKKLEDAMRHTMPGSR
ncbi:MAG: PDDEXK nuclease domain-containing protein [Rubrivivax sp.]|nr:PDDEXK nuclease domain-containing protein [Rubrivivax sp.]